MSASMSAARLLNGEHTIPSDSKLEYDRNQTEGCRARNPCRTDGLGSPECNSKFELEFEQLLATSLSGNGLAHSTHTQHHIKVG
jgi:hypothetical protein